MSRGTDEVGDEWVYVVTDIETNGPRPGEHSMLSFASVAVDSGGTVIEEFEGVLTPLDDTRGDPETMAWFATVPQAWEAATRDPEPAYRVIEKYVSWLSALPSPRRFAAAPLGFDGPYIDFYLRRFSPYTLIPAIYEPDNVFQGAPLCLTSYLSAITGKPMEQARRELEPSWLGNIEHTHRAIDDARGYGHLLGEMFRRAGAPDS